MHADTMTTTIPHSGRPQLHPAWREAMETFELNGQTYGTDAETLAVLRSLMPSARETGDSSAVQAMLYAGLQTGRIVAQGPA